MSKKIIIDTDIALGYFIKDVDDGLAIALALNSPELNVIGITTVFGNATLPKVNASIGKLLEKWNETHQNGYKNLSLYSGATKPLYQLDLENITEDIKSGRLFPAVKYLRDTIYRYPNEIIIAPIGPLTNIALLFKLFPEVINKIKYLSIMGGKLNASEFNFFNDQIATDFVLRSSVTTDILGLEVCQAQQFTLSHYLKLINNKTDFSLYLARKIRSWLIFNRATLHFGRKESGFYPFDPCAIVNIIDPSIFKKVKVPVYHELPKFIKGSSNIFSKTKIDHSKYKDKTRDTSTDVNWALKIDSEKLMNILIERLK